MFTMHVPYDVVAARRRREPETGGDCTKLVCRLELPRRTVLRNASVVQAASMVNELLDSDGVNNRIVRLIG